MNRKETWTEHDDMIRAALRVPVGEHTDHCLEPDDLLELVEQGGKHPRSQELLRHVLDCGFCRNEYQEMRKTVALMEKARALQQPSVVPVPLPPKVRWFDRLLDGLKGQQRFASAFALAAVLIIAVIALRPGGVTKPGQPNGVADEFWLKTVESVENGIKKERVAIADLKFQLPGSQRGEGVEILGPDRTLVRTTEPVLRWKEVEFATSYEVNINTLAGKQIAVSGPINGTQWTVDAGKLHPEQDYFWSVTAQLPGKSPMTSDRTIFRVAEPKKTALLDRAIRTYAKDRVFIGAFAAKLGFFDDAEAELSAVSSSEPRKSSAQKLLASIRKQRE